VDQERNTVSESEFKYPSWQIPLQEAILELDHERLAEKIKEVEAIMSDRLHTMPSAANNNDERQALADGASILRELRKEKLS
jgi:hypothetical protein